MRTLTSFSKWKKGKGFIEQQVYISPSTVNRYHIYNIYHTLWVSADQTWLSASNKLLLLFCVLLRNVTVKVKLCSLSKIVGLTSNNISLMFCVAVILVHVEVQQQSITMICWDTANLKQRRFKLFSSVLHCPTGGNSACSTSQKNNDNTHIKVQK